MGNIIGVHSLSWNLQRDVMESNDSVLCSQEASSGRCHAERVAVFRADGSSSSQPVHRHGMQNGMACTLSH